MRTIPIIDAEYGLRYYTDSSYEEEPDEEPDYDRELDLESQIEYMIDVASPSDYLP